MSKDKNQNVILRGWQSDVVNMIQEHESIRGEERYQGVTDWSINKDLAIQVAMPKGSGHTFLANYIASNIPSIIVYKDMANYREFSEMPFHNDSETASMYEIYFAIHNHNTQGPAQDLLEMNKKMATQKVIVVDNALRLPISVKDYIFSIAQGPIVLLGH